MLLVKKHIERDGSGFVTLRRHARRRGHVARLQPHLQGRRATRICSQAHHERERDWLDLVAPRPPAAHHPGRERPLLGTRRFGRRRRRRRVRPVLLLGPLCRRRVWHGRHDDAPRLRQDHERERARQEGRLPYARPRDRAGLQHHQGRGRVGLDRAGAAARDDRARARRRRGRYRVWRRASQHLHHHEPHDHHQAAHRRARAQEKEGRRDGVGRRAGERQVSEPGLRRGCAALQLRRAQGPHHRVARLHQGDRALVSHRGGSATRQQVALAGQEQVPPAALADAPRALAHPDLVKPRGLVAAQEHQVRAGGRHARKVFQDARREPAASVVRRGARAASGRARRHQQAPRLGRALPRAVGRPPAHVRQARRGRQGVRRRGAHVLVDARVGPTTEPADGHCGAAELPARHRSHRGGGAGRGGGEKGARTGRRRGRARRCIIRSTCSPASRGCSLRPFVREARWKGWPTSAPLDEKELAGPASLSCSSQPAHELLDLPERPHASQPPRPATRRNPPTRIVVPRVVVAPLASRPRPLSPQHQEPPQPSQDTLQHVYSARTAVNMSWAPQQQGLEELVACLSKSGSADNKVQESIQERLESFNKIPDYNSYLVYILTQMPSEDVTVRSMAGLLLKNNIRLYLNDIQPDVVAYIKANIFGAIADPMSMIRNTVSTVINQLVVELKPENYIEALSRLLELVDSSDQYAQEGAFASLDKLCQDIPKALEQLEVSGQRPLDVMIPKFLSHIDSPYPKIRNYALSCAIQFISPDNNALTLHLEPFIVGLFKHASDDSTEVRKTVCQALVQLLATRPDVLVPHMANVVDFMLYSTQDIENDEVALEACEFWLTFAEDPELVNHLRPFLPKVIPVLVQSMVYSEDDILLLDTNEDDAAVPDKASDIKPHLLSSKAHTHDRLEDAAGAAGANGAQPGGHSRERADDEDEDEDDEDDYDDDDDEDEEAYTEWNLRKCAAAALDVMAVAFEVEMLEVLLPYLKEKLFSPDWLDRESGILALGAIAEGCITGIEPHLPILMNFLINSLNDPKPLVRSIACWTIGRYSSWTIKEDATPEHRQQFFVPAMEGLLKMCLDNNKRVQEAGCSAFATLEEEAGPELEPFLGSILGNLVFAFNKYQQKNLLILYDAIGTLADAVGTALNHPPYIEILMPPLIQKWSTLNDSDPDLIPLLECMSSVVIAIGPGFGQFAEPVFSRCINLVKSSLIEAQQYQQDPINYDEPDKTFLIVSLDLLSGLTQGLNTAITQLYSASDPPVLTLLAMCLQHPDAPVRQSSYALLGDTAISCFPILKPLLPQFMPVLVSHIEVEPRLAEVSVCNNAAWAAGEIALQAGADMEPFVNPLMERLVPILISSKAARSLTENSAVTIGRLAIVCPQLVAPHLQVFVQAWCQALADIKDNEEKDSAFRGICAAIQVNPNGISTAFGFFLNAVARWSRPSEQLNEMFKTILHAFKGMSEGAAWDAQLAHLPPVIVQRLRERYGV